ncbi:MAG: DUF3842 family protein [Acidaminococcaceae bacterium]
MVQKKAFKIAFVDGMGGGLAAQVINQLAKQVPREVEIIGLGTNAAATAAMVKAGADKGATGENAICFSVQNADLIVGPIGIVLPNAMLGEISPQIATAIASAKGKKILIPVSQNHVQIVGLENKSLTHLVKETVAQILESSV